MLAVESLHLDLASLAEIRSFAAELAAAHPTIDLLVNNAGVFCDTRRRTEDGLVHEGTRGPRGDREHRASGRCRDIARDPRVWPTAADAWSPLLLKRESA